MDHSFINWTLFALEIEYTQFQFTSFSSFISSGDIVLKGNKQGSHGTGSL